MGDEQGQSGIIAENPVVIFLDENHCRNAYLIRAIEEFGLRCEKHLDHFSSGTADLDWLPEIGRRGWCLLTSDARIRWNFLEKEAVRLNAVAMFYFASNNLNGQEIGQVLRSALPAIMTLVLNQRPPFIASLSKPGKITLRESFAGSGSGKDPRR